MQIHHSSASPFVRKCMVVAHEVGLADRIELLATAVHPVNRNQTVVARNPTGKVPTFITDEGDSLFDSRVICEYLDAQAQAHGQGGGGLFPPAGPARWRALVGQAVADGLMDAAVLCRYESTVRPADRLYQPWLDGQFAKVDSALEAIEREAAGYGDRVDIATISVGCALGYLDFRFADRPWRPAHPAAAAWFETFSRRPSMQATAPA